jgi:hypothetical protein
MDLLFQIKQLVAQERRITAELLKLLDRAERERLYARRGYVSLYEFCVKELGYSEGAAVRRVKAMRLMNDHAEVENKIVAGSLSLSVATQLQTVLKKGDFSLEKQREVIASVEGMSTRDAERKLIEVAPVIERPKRELRPITATESVLKIVVDQSLLEKLDQLRANFSHKKPGMSYRDLLELLVNKALIKIQHRANGVGEAVRYISPALKTKIRERDGGRCTYIDPLTKRRCEARHFLEFDHIKPVAHGGRATEENLRLLCRTHNQLAAEDAGLISSVQTNPSSSRQAVH